MAVKSRRTFTTVAVFLFKIAFIAGSGNAHAQEDKGLRGCFGEGGVAGGLPVALRGTGRR